jgi:vanillate O-demethylase monooxygenase subunit
MNAWYVAAWSDELQPGKMLQRRLLDIPVLLLRNQRGDPGALLDRCPHRFAPLGCGSMVEDGVRCRYHGLVFDVNGACISNPHGAKSEALRVRRFTVHEAFRAIWIWFGDAAPDHRALPDFSFIDRTPESAFNKGYLHSTGDYQLYIDNIMDLTHADYLHPTTLGGDIFNGTKAAISEDDSSVTVKWTVFRHKPPPVWEKFLKLGDADADLWTEVCWHAPSAIRLIQGAKRSDAAAGTGMNNVNLHLLTPESARSTHYFFASTRDFWVDDGAFNTRLGEMRKQIFATEDKPMIEAIDERMEGQEFWSLRPALLTIDGGPVKVRRKLEQRMAAERIAAQGIAVGDRERE